MLKKLNSPWVASIFGLVAFMAYHLRLLSPVQVMLGTYTNLLTGGVALGRVFELLDIPIDVRESTSAVTRPSLRGEVVFDRVRFRHATDVPVLEEISLRIPAGCVCARSIAITARGSQRRSWPRPGTRAAPASVHSSGSTTTW